MVCLGSTFDVVGGMLGLGGGGGGRGGGGGEGDTYVMNM